MEINKLKSEISNKLIIVTDFLASIKMSSTERKMCKKNIELIYEVYYAEINLEKVNRKFIPDIIEIVRDTRDVDNKESCICKLKELFSLFSEFIIKQNNVEKYIGKLEKEIRHLEKENKQLKIENEELKEKTIKPKRWVLNKF